MNLINGEKEILEYSQFVVNFKTIHTYSFLLFLNTNAL